MSAKALPYFRWYPADAETDERYSAMTDEELGFYHRCLNRSWINVGLPADLGQLAAVMRVKRAYLEKVWRRVGLCFSQTLPDRPDRLFNRRQEEERDRVTVVSNKASASVANRDDLKAPGFIYLIRREFDGTVKIGSTGNVPRRLAQLKYKYRDSLELIAKFPVPSMGTSELELHQKYSSSRLNGEWFRLSPEEIKEIKDMHITRVGDSVGDSVGDTCSHPAYHTSPRAYESGSDSSVKVREGGLGETPDLVLARILARHPKKSGPNYAESAFFEIVGPSQDQHSKALEVDESHLRWCCYWASAGVQSRYVPKLFDWLNSGDWKVMPPIVEVDKKSGGWETLA